MELYFLVALVIVAFILYQVLVRKRTNKTKEEAKSVVYEYTSKQNIMTQAESDFFKILVQVAGDRYYIFPQVHLSAIFEHKTKGQNWNAAFKHINGKSVDFVLCDKQSLLPTYAVELDDSSHQLPDRTIRDIEIERIFKSVGMPLVRFTNYRSLTLEDVAQRFFEAHES